MVRGPPDLPTYLPTCPATSITPAGRAPSMPIRLRERARAAVLPIYLSTYSAGRRGSGKASEGRPPRAPARALCFGGWARRPISRPTLRPTTKPLKGGPERSWRPRCALPTHCVHCEGGPAYLPSESDRLRAPPRCCAWWVGRPASRPPLAPGRMLADTRLWPPAARRPCHAVAGGRSTYLPTYLPAPAI
jgi:hypothetical protein